MKALAKHQTKQLSRSVDYHPQGAEMFIIKYDTNIFGVNFC